MNDLSFKKIEGEPVALQRHLFRDSRANPSQFSVQCAGEELGQLSYSKLNEALLAPLIDEAFRREYGGNTAAIDFLMEDGVSKRMGNALIAAFLREKVFPEFKAALIDVDKGERELLKQLSLAGFLTLCETDRTVFMVAKREPKPNPIVILGSSRGEGETRKAIDLVIGNHAVPIVDLLTIDLFYFDYFHENRHDDFLPLMERIACHQQLILATPVYWYSMSGVMKTFLDRWSDLLLIRKDLGKRLAGKELYVISASAGHYEGFELAFAQTCHYLQMRYMGCYHYYAGKNPQQALLNIPNAKVFTQSIWGEDHR